LSALRKPEGAGAEASAEVFQLWLRAAERGNAAAQRMVGDMYLRGAGAHQSVDEARRWLNDAVLQGHVPAMVLLGGLLLQHASGDEDRVRAFDLF
jgi:hypothetical protein